MHIAAWKLADMPHGEACQTADSPGLSVTRRRLTGGASDGIEMLEVSNPASLVRLLPTRGMSVWDMEVDGVRIGWQSPAAGPIHPSLVNLAEPDGLGWLRGFDELLVRCGLESNGAPNFSPDGSLRYPLHGRIANTPAKDVEVSIDPEAQQLTVVGVVEEARLHFSKLRLTSTLTMRLGTPGFEIHDRVENFGGTTAGCQLLYHINVGTPWLGPQSQLVAPVETLAPRDPVSAHRTQGWDTLGPPIAGAPEQAFYSRLHANPEQQTGVVLVDGNRSTGVKLGYDADALPCFTFWKNEVAFEDGYVVGLEPATNYPNPRSFEEGHGRVVELAPGGAYECHLQLEYLPDVDRVEKAIRFVEDVQGIRSSVRRDQPHPEWSLG